MSLAKWDGAGESFVSKAPVSLEFSQEKVRVWALMVAGGSHIVFIHHLLCTVFIFLFVGKKAPGSHVHPQRRDVCIIITETFPLLRSLVSWT